MKRSVNRTAAAFFASSLLLVFAGSARAEFPERPVHFIVGFTAGGGVDTLARVVGAKLSEKWGQPVIVENRAGADGTVAASFVANSAKDGYNLAFITTGHTASVTQTTLSYDAVKSFEPITQVAYVPDVLVIVPSLPVKNLPELVAYVKANPNKLNFGSSGAASAPFLEMADLMKQTGMKMIHVPYQGGSAAAVAMLTGEIQLKFAAMPTITGQVDAKQIIAIAVSSKTRSPVMPTVPTVEEAMHFDHFDAAQSDWTGVLAPAGTPKNIVTKINKDMAEAIHSPDVQERLSSLGFVPVGDSPEEFTATLQREIPRWAALLKEFNPK